MSEKCSGQCQSSPINGDLKIDTQLDNYSGAFVSTYKVPQMDCPSEERLIRLALDWYGSLPLGCNLISLIDWLKFIHDDNLEEITNKLTINLNLGSQLESTKKSCSTEAAKAKNLAQKNEMKEASTLKWLLAINGSHVFCRNNCWDYCTVCWPYCRLIRYVC